MRKALAATLTERHGLKIVSGGTDSHLSCWLTCAPRRLTGKFRLEKACSTALHITTNKNSIPGDPEKYTIVTSGVRLGTPAGTSRGFGVAEFQQIGHLIADVLDVHLPRMARTSDSPRSRPQVRGPRCTRLCSRASRSIR